MFSGAAIVAYVSGYGAMADAGGACLSLASSRRVLAGRRLRLRWNSARNIRLAATMTIRF